MRQGTTTKDKHMTETNDEVQTLVAKHLEFKRKATDVLHDLADYRDWCSDFDYILVNVGLPGREDFVDADEQVTPVGEPTVEAFEQWKLATVTTLHERARRYGIADYEDALRKAGFDPDAGKPVRKEIRIQGTFDVPLTVEVVEGQDLIKAVSRHAVAERVFAAFMRRDDDVTWKAINPD